MLNKLAVGPARSANYSWDGEMIAVGLKNGGFVVLNTGTFRVWGQRRDRGSMINVIRYVLFAAKAFAITRYLRTCLVVEPLYCLLSREPASE